MLALYRAALRIRRTHPALGDGSLTWADAPGSILAFEREPGFVCAVNMGPQAATLRGSYELVCASGQVEHVDDGLVLPADTAVWLKGPLYQ